MLHLEIITLDRVAYTGEVDSIVVPSVDGAIGIFPRHTNLFAKLTDGEIKIKKAKENLFLAIGGGFVEVIQNKVNVLVTRAVHADELDEKEILQAKKSAEEALAKKESTEDVYAARQMFRRSLVDLKILRKRKKKATH